MSPPVWLVDPEIDHHGRNEHGFGAQLYKHAVYIRSIPGYIQQKPEFNQYYLQPFEILLRLTRQLKAK